MPVRATVQANLLNKNGLAEDTVVNTWHFEADEAGALPDRGRWDDDIVGLNSRLVTFYQAIAGSLSNSLSGALVLKSYDMSDPKPRVPRRTQTATIVPSSTSLPNEVAMCLSMRGNIVSGQPMARRRGRVFLGPFRAAESGPAGTGGDSRPAQSTVDTILNAAVTMARGGAGSFRLAVFSPTIDAQSPGSEAAWNDVTHLWIDNAWDTQRRRGAKPTSRSTRDLTG